MTISLVSTGTFATATGGGSLNPAVGAYQVGDLFLLSTGEFFGTHTLSAPAGWVQLSVSASSPQTYIFGRIAQSLTESMPTITWGAATITWAVIDVFRGVDPGLIACFIPQRRQATFSDVIFMGATTLIPDQPGCLVFAAGSRNKTSTSDGNTFTAPANFTSLGSQAQAGSGTTSTRIYWIQTSAQLIAQNLASTASIVESASMAGGIIGLRAAPATWSAPLVVFPGRSPGLAPLSGRFYQSSHATATQPPLGGESDLLIGQSATLTATGTLGGTAALSIGESGVSGALGTLAGTSALLLGQSAAGTGMGAVTGSSALLWGETGALTGAGSLSTAAALALGQSGGISGSGALLGSAALAVGQSALLTGASQLNAAAALAFDASATAVSGALSGTSALTLSASGTLDQPGMTSAGAVDSPRIAEGFYRRKKRKPKTPVLPTPPLELPAALIERAPTFTALTQTLGLAPAVLSARLDAEIEYLLREQAERDDEEALVWILSALD